MEALIAAFVVAGFSKVHCKHAHPDGYFDIAFYDDGVYDQLHVREDNGRITWVDFSHTTDLGPINGKEILERLENHAKSVRNGQGGSRTCAS